MHYSYYIKSISLCAYTVSVIAITTISFLIERDNRTLINPEAESHARYNTGGETQSLVLPLLSAVIAFTRTTFSLMTMPGR